MQKNSLNNIIWLVILGCLITSLIVTPVYASFWQTKTTELDKVKQKITGLKSNLNQAKNTQSSLQQELKTIEKAIGQTSRELAKIDVDIQKQNNILNKLYVEEQNDQSELQSQKLMLAKQANAAYKLGQHRYLKLLLNEQDPNTASRLLIEYKYINQARLKFIAHIDKTIEKIKANQQQIKRHTQVSQNLHQKQAAKQRKLMQKYQQRKHILLKLDQSIETKQQQLDDLLSNKHALENVIAKIEATAKRTYLSHFWNTNTPFEHLKGQLNWPIIGSIIEHFGEQISNSGLMNNAITIAGPIGEEVHVIYPGRIVFADWLRGVGLLIIVNHGNGFMTLYGHNSSLYEKVGDYVKAGAVIATVGKSGGYEKSGLYFQIRHNGTPLNPEEWLRRKV